MYLSLKFENVSSQVLSNLNIKVLSSFAIQASELHNFDFIKKEIDNKIFN